MSTWALLMAAGSGTRMASGQNKALLPLQGEPVLLHSARTLLCAVDGLVIVARPEDMDAIAGLETGCRMVPGGDTRQQSVLRGLLALPEDADIVLVHDAARPFVNMDTIHRCIESVRQYGSGVAGMPVKDTIKQVDASGGIAATPDRASLWVAQTPQAFDRLLLLEALTQAEAAGIAVTDDASAVEWLLRGTGETGRRVRMVEGSYANFKLTTPEDMLMAEGLTAAPRTTRVGHGYDVHRLAEGRPLMLCGVHIPHPQGLLGHSDADVALHALMDALLGACGLGDIGRHFPDSDPQYAGISSMVLLKRVAQLLAEGGFRLQNADITIVAQKPKLSGYLPQMAQSVAAVLGVPPQCINVKATTTEGLGFEGEMLGISAHAVVLLL